MFDKAPVDAFVDAFVDMAGFGTGVSVAVSFLGLVAPVAGVRCPGPRATASDIVAMSSFFGLIGFGLCLVSVRSVADECQSERIRFYLCDFGLRLG